ncbi:brix domain-containing protein [Tieghemostelium lacteum]|uniref:Brix domain-containing protein n=1 Tax=Tieghemostelium lacteum TaxID=361077 RepID=A0A151ZJ65_TIELA|nr:brix domain-containing protein [Tieghemostelium lacteum]|eukprot:KYQ93996.1 brix domain-containing protein [Tieghemostelium lacteum]
MSARLLRMKKDVDTDDYSPSEYKLRRSPNDIKCKSKRMELVGKLMAAKKIAREQSRKLRKKERDNLGDQAPPKQVPRTIESMRRADETVVDKDDGEFDEEINNDEFASYFNGKPPKTCITTNQQSGHEAKNLARMFSKIFPNSGYFNRRTYNLKEIIEFCNNREYTDLVVINETKGKVDELIISHLPNGPTATFRLTSLEFPHEIAGSGKITSHTPELIVNNFTTRLGHTIGRMFASLFPQQPEFHGRRVVTLHNQRDFIFFRQHRYAFESLSKANLHELGPRFTLKLLSLQHGTFNTSSGEYIHIHKHDMDVDRKKFVL